MWRRLFWFASLLAFAVIVLLHEYEIVDTFVFVVFFIFFAIGLHDIFQKKSNILRNYPVIGHLRYLLLKIRPEIRQYFFESEQDGKPFSAEIRNLIYARAAKVVDTLPFGTQRDVRAIGFESINHSLSPKKVLLEEARILIGGKACRQPYSASRLNISALSFGALSQTAIRALNRGAKLGGFAHNTGEGGVSPYHLAEGGDLIWQIGTGYFGCRDKQGHFDPVLFEERSMCPAVKMIEIKLSQGAKPAHGGILPAAKVSEEIAGIRGLDSGEDCISPPAHTAFSDPIGLLEFVARLRELSGGKPVGFKLCIGLPKEFLSICKAILKTGIAPDFITIDGAEGGTGAAPVEFTDFVGTPLVEGLVFVHNSLVGIGVRDQLRLIASGKITTGFDMVAKLALGADLCNAARAMMFSLGCVQSRRCHTNRCPTGIATQDPSRYYALSVEDKAPKVANYHEETVKSFLDVLGAAGISQVSDLHRGHISKRLDATTVKSYDALYPSFTLGQFLQGELPGEYAQWWAMASATQF